MRLSHVERWKAVLPLLVVLTFPHELRASYFLVGPAEPAPGQKAAGGSAPTTGIDSLTAPIALYPDALIAQILKASTDVAALQKFGGWLKGNASLKGTELQDAAQKAGFAACYIALAPFPQVVQMLVEKPDWTTQLGKAFTTNQSAVFDSIQRLRAQAQAVGNLKTTPQQEVVTETTSSGQQVIVIQPSNPQVVYVPVYNTQTVYVQSAPPQSSSASVAAGAMVGFTVGVIIGNSSNHYYGGPYAWRGASMYEEAWDRREDYLDNRQDYYEDRRDNYQDNASQRQSAAQSNQAQRQSAAQSNQAQRQSAAQANQPQRQGNQSQRQAAASTSSAGSGQAAKRSGGSSGISGYQSGGSARAESARGNASRASSRKEGGSRRR